MRLWFSTLLMLLASCTGADTHDVRASSTKSGDKKGRQKSGEGSATFIDIPNEGNNNVESSAGATVAGTTTAAYLTMPIENLEVLTLAVSFTEAEGANYRDATQIRVHQEALTDSERESMVALQNIRANEKLVVFYHTHAPISSLDGLYVVGIIPPSRVERNGSLYTFFLEGGYGTYQVAKVVLDSKATIPLESLEPKLTITEVQKPNSVTRNQIAFEAPDEELLPESVKKVIKERVESGVSRQGDTNAKLDLEQLRDNRTNGNGGKSDSTAGQSNQNNHVSDNDDGRKNDDDNDDDDRGDNHGSDDSRRNTNGNTRNSDGNNTAERIDHGCPAGFVFIEEIKIEVATEQKPSSDKKDKGSKWKKKDGVTLVTVPDFCVMRNEARNPDTETQDLATGTGTIVRDITPRDSESLRTTCARTAGSLPLTVYQAMAVLRRIATEGQNFSGRGDERQFRKGLTFSAADLPNPATTARCPAGANCNSRETPIRGHFVTEDTRIFDLMGGLTEYAVALDGTVMTFKPEGSSAQLNFAAPQVDANGITFRCAVPR